MQTQQRREPTASQHATRSDSKSSGRSLSSQLEIGDSAPNRTPSLDDLRVVATDIKETLSEAISDLKINIQGVVTHLGEVEEVTAHHDAAIQEVGHISDAHSNHILELHRRN